MKADETYLDEFGEAIVWTDEDFDRAIHMPLREDTDGFRERLDEYNAKYDERITQAVRVEDAWIVDEELAQDAETK
jgi:hypothetical protein